MLQSSNHHYLRPDYMTAAAAPTALDNKSSPLALLAQTCSAIGADTANPKLLAANIEKSTKQQPKGIAQGMGNGNGPGLGDSTRDKSSPVSSHSSSVSTGSVEQQQLPPAHSKTPSTFKPYEANNNDCGATNLSSNLNSSSTSNNGNSQRVKTPKANGQQRCDSNQSASSSQRESPSATASSTLANGAPLRRTPTTAGAAQINGSPVMMQSASMPVRSNSKESAALSSPSAAAAAAAAATSNRLQEAVYAAAKEASYVKALHAASQQASPSAASYYPPGYGAPYPMDLMTASSLMSPHHAMFKASAMSPYLNYARLKGLAEPSAMMAAAPNVCRDPYCTGCPASPHYINKAAGQPCPAGCPQCERFGTSDDLFQHLRTHTASVPDAVLSAAAAGGIPPNHPLFQRTYPTPPLSPLSAAARYHPYGKPSMLPPSLAPPGLPGLPPHPALAQYFAPYSLYGPRMGSSHP
ncbi:hypothetical protein KR093_009540 [Drosophila rubida]|uniref:Zinc finger protein Elbow n=1 Tax=Drosophila rubida TaxID=30044 RepID=A0AAD4K5Z4_9MUSC|nr:hypothetical protein KR093_009540 [Drosophila rubida]